MYIYIYIYIYIYSSDPHFYNYIKKTCHLSILLLKIGGDQKNMYICTCM